MSDVGVPVLRVELLQALEANDWDRSLRLGLSILETSEDAQTLDIVATAAWWLDNEKVVFDARERLFRLLRAQNDGAGAARVAIRLSWDCTIFRGDFAVAGGWVARARRLLDDGPSSDRALLLVREACLESDPSVARPLLAAAASMARDVGALDVEMLAVVQEGVLLVAEGRIGEGLACLDGPIMAACAGELSDPLAVTLACCKMLQACADVGDYERANRWTSQIDLMAARKNTASLLTVSRCLYAPLLMARGDFVATEAILLEGLRYFEEKVPSLSGEVLVGLAELRRHQGRVAEAERLLDRAEPAPGCRFVRAELALESGRARLAAEHAAAFLRQTRGGYNLVRCAALVVLARASAALGLLPEARAAIGALREIDEAIATFPTRAGVQLASAALLEAEGDLEGARSALEDAADLYARSLAPYEASRAREQLAVVLDDLGRPQDAADQRAVAAASLGKLRRERSDGTLTRRELEVARLIAEGLSDMEIARHLHISEHTVHRHVANLRRRLDAPSRAAAVACAKELGLL